MGEEAAEATVGEQVVAVVVEEVVAIDEVIVTIDVGGGHRR